MLNVQELRVTYGRVEALHGVSLEIKHGQIVTIIGANGAGKSTLLNVISGIVRPKGGKILFEGRPSPSSVAKVVEMGVVQVPEGRRIFPTLTVEENLVMGGFTVKNRRVLEERKERAFTLFPILADRRKQFGGTLSGGEQQMLAIGRGLMSAPKLLLLDEPSLGLAPIVVRDLFRLFREINEQGVTILLVEQNARQALAIADQAYVFETGRVVNQGKGNDLLNDPSIKKAYLGV
jgi:branched-chain amino acid transport system ATP-binding protein